MGQEIERKFLVDIDKLGTLKNGQSIKQGYIPTINNTVVRARIRGNKAFMTLKGPSQGFSRLEFEYEIPVKDAETILSTLCSKSMISKTRYLVSNAEHTWEIDVFHSQNDGLVIAEVELKDADEYVNIPDWVTKEVTGDHRYSNSNLCGNPYKNWK